MEQSLIFDSQFIIGVKSDSGYSLEYKPSIDELSIDSSDLTVDLEIFNNKKIIVIDSTNSGVGRDNRDIYTPILKVLLDKYGIDHEYHATTSPDSINEIGAKLTEGKYLVILISGDTSVNEFLNALSHHDKGDITIFTIPFGTGNSLALSLNYTNELVAISKLFTKPKINPFNLYDITLPSDTWELKQSKRVKQMPLNYKFLVVFSWGFHASLVADSDTPELRKYGLERFKMAAMKNLENPQQYPGITTIKGANNNQVIPGPYYYWLLTPSTKFEPTFEISPKGSIFNDSLYLVSFGIDTDIMTVMQQVYNKGSHVNNPKVTYKEINHEISLKFEQLPENPRFCIDGLIVQTPPSGELLIKSIGNEINNWKIFLA